MKNALKIIIRCIIALLPLCVMWWYAAVKTFNFIDDEAPYYRWNKNLVNSKNKEKYDVVFLGDSAGNAAFMPELVSEKSLNLALGGATPIEQYYTLKNYLKNNTHPKEIAISFMDFHFSEFDCFWERTIYMHLLSTRDELQVFYDAYAFNEESIIKDGFISDYLQYKLYFPSKYLSSMKNAALNGRKIINEDRYKYVELHRGRYIAQTYATWSGLNKKKQTTLNQFKVGAIQDYYYKKIIKLCVENSIKVTLLKLPVSPIYRYSVNYETQFEDYYKQITMKYPQVSVIWLDKNWEQDYFFDAYHMNLKGSERLTLRLNGLLWKKSRVTKDKWRVNGMLDYDKLRTKKNY